MESSSVNVRCTTPRMMPRAVNGSFGNWVGAQAVTTRTETKNALKRAWKEMSTLHARKNPKAKIEGLRRRYGVDELSADGLQRRLSLGCRALGLPEDLSDSLNTSEQLLRCVHVNLLLRLRSELHGLPDKV